MLQKKKRSLTGQEFWFIRSKANTKNILKIENQLEGFC